MRFRRRIPDSDGGLLSADDLRLLLAAAAKRTVALERTIAVLQSALNRSVDSHRLFCTHAAQLVESKHSLAETERLLAETKRSEELMYQRLRGHLASLQQIGNATTQIIPVVSAIDEQEPR